MPREAPPRARDLADDEVHVWRAVLDVRPSSIRRALAHLNELEQRRAGRFRFAVHRDRWVASRALLRVLLAEYLGVSPAAVPIRPPGSGKPALESGDRDPDLRFNLTHSGDVVLVAVARGRSVGVDLERMRRGMPVERLASRFFTPREARALREVPPPSRPAAFFACWTRKEAFLKGTGYNLERGLPFALSTFAVSVDVESRRPPSLSVPGRPEIAARWSLHDLDVGSGYAGALAVEGSARPRLFYWDPERL